MNLCQTCKYWNLAPHNDGTHYPKGWGWCNLINGMATTDNLAYAISADATTSPEFGCIQHEVKE